MSVRDALCCVSLAAVFLTGSCSSPTAGFYADPVANHPLSVEPHYTEAGFPAPAPAAQLPPQDSARLGAFVAGYLERGRGAISVAVPAGVAGEGIIAFFGEKLAMLGVPRERIVVGSYPAGPDAPVKIGYVDYAVRSTPCGQGRDNPGSTLTNKPMTNLGCANQHNLAAQIADPHDLAVPRASEPADAMRRTAVGEKYETGDDTAGSKSGDKSAKISDVGNKGQ